MSRRLVELNVGHDLQKENLVFDKRLVRTNIYLIKGFIVSFCSLSCFSLLSTLLKNFKWVYLLLVLLTIESLIYKRLSF